MEKVKSFLEEGFDFIEESCSVEPLEFTEVEDYTLSESEGTESKYKVLGVCKGVFQPINEPSRNGRIYESNHWSMQLDKPEVQERIKSRSMWGTLGHFDRRISDADIREGLVSHIISKLEIHEDINNKPFLYGELEILDTPAGRILEAMYKGGANLYVSSRGAGKLLSVVGDTMKHVDPNSFWFEGFDIVRAPGFLKARPVYEGIKEASEVSESQVNEEVKEHLPAGQKEDLLTPVYGAMNTKRARKGKKMLSDDQIKKNTCEAEEIEELKGQINKLAKIVEKVVDDVYEEPTSEAQEEPKQKVMAEKPAESKQMQEQPIAPVDKKEANEALVDFVKLMASTNISEDKFSEILDIIAASKKENK